MVMSRYQNAERNHNLLNANKPLENVANLKYFGTTITNQYCIQEEIMSTLNWEFLLPCSSESFVFPSPLGFHKNRKVS